MNGEFFKRFNFPETFDFQLERSPDLFVMNNTQNMFVVVAQGDILLVDHNSGKKIEIDEKFGVCEIRACINAYERFYIFANKKDKQRGIFLLEIKEDDFDKIWNDNFDDE
jgi:hypothetical protein